VISRPFLRAVLWTGAAALCCPAAADAQIYVWRDPAGNVVLSDKKKDPLAKTYSVAPAGGATFRTTLPLSRRAAQYESLIEEHASLNDVNPDLVRAVIQAESAFDPRARSVKGAMGLMQLMPATASELGVDDPYNPAQNIRGGVKYLKQLLDAYDGRVELALAAYNAGPGAVKKYGGTVPPYRETQDYVARISGKVSAEGTTGAAASPGTRVYQTVEQTADGRLRTVYTSKPREGSELVKTVQRR
jgi:soluble lytic murein transglycosylase-like protein